VAYGQNDYLLCVIFHDLKGRNGGSHKGPTYLVIIN
jgi:hypothetical protein